MLREQVPQRRDVAERTDYREYRGDLEIDFNNRCGYCDDSSALVDPITFHIDHFAPKSNFPELKTSYINLVYSCRFCNVSKSNKWIGNDPAVSNNGQRGFVDPCNQDYDNHLKRSPEGRIVPKTELGIYMFLNLKLYLRRHECLWVARKLIGLREEVDRLIERIEERIEQGESFWDGEYLLLLRSFKKLTHEYDRYLALVWNRNG
ncbi:MAG: HNH endonuclease [Paracoccaceae bacterium]|nr:HNH endonuclease [Paracoccaceae bacterium]MDE2917843.1 HNH endonuclease [Paracoccaceae bacterium]